MAYLRNITAADHAFFDTDFVLSFTIYAGNPTAAQIAAGEAVPEDVSGWALEWMLRKKVTSPDPPLILKTTAGSPAAIAIVGTYDADPEVNTQRVEVTIADTDTYDTEADPAVELKAGEYVHALKRVDAGSETVLTYGTFTLLRTAAWETP